MIGRIEINCLLECHQDIFNAECYEELSRKISPLSIAKAASTDSDICMEAHHAAVAAKERAERLAMMAQSFAEFRQSGDTDGIALLSAFERQFAKLPKIARIIDKLTKRCTSSTKPSRLTRERLRRMENHRSNNGELNKAWKLAQRLAEEFDLHAATRWMTAWKEEEHPKRDQARFEMIAAQLRGGWWKPRPGEFDWRSFLRPADAFTEFSNPGRGATAAPHDVERVVPFWNERIANGMAPDEIKRQIVQLRWDEHKAAERAKETKRKADYRAKVKAMNVANLAQPVEVDRDAAAQLLIAWLDVRPRRVRDQLVKRIEELLTLHGAWLACVMRLGRDPKPREFAIAARLHGGAEFVQSEQSIKTGMKHMRVLHADGGPWSL